jgi:hypothetical protein
MLVYYVMDVIQIGDQFKNITHSPLEMIPVPIYLKVVTH